MSILVIERTRLYKHFRKDYIMLIGEQKISTVMPHLQDISIEFGLCLCKLKDFRIARGILAIRFTSEN